MMSLIEGSG